MSWYNAFRVRMNTLAIVLIPACIAIDWTGHAIASTLKPARCARTSCDSPAARRCERNRLPKDWLSTSPTPAPK